MAVDNLEELVRRFLESEWWNDPEILEDRALERMIRRMRLGLRLGEAEPCQGDGQDG